MLLMVPSNYEKDYFKKRLENILQELIYENKTANIKEEILEKMLG